MTFKKIKMFPELKTVTCTRKRAMKVTKDNLDEDYYTFSGSLKSGIPSVIMTTVVQTITSTTSTMTT